jgi:Amt family ammonium transporter
MDFFTFLYGRNLRLWLTPLLWSTLLFTGGLRAQSTINIPNPGATAPDSTNSVAPSAPATNAIPELALPTPEPATNSVSEVTPPPPPAPLAAPTPTPSASSINPTGPSLAPATGGHSTGSPAWLILGALLTLASSGGFVLYQTGLTRAKNCGHTATLLLVGLMAGLIGYWMGGFAVQNGGMGDAHAALAEPNFPASTAGLDHELGTMALGHHWGLMGSAGFFLMTEESTRNDIALLFLIQAALMSITVAAALGAGLERGRLLSLAIGAFLIGAVIYPLFANWVWGGGWLAELGREYGLGHGFIDLAGAGVIHQTAGTLALVIAVVLGPRYGKFGREKIARAIPGHNVPFIILGTLILLISWTAANAFASTNPLADSTLDVAVANAGSAAVNALLAGAAGLLISIFATSWSKQRPEPALLCRGLLGGVVAVSSCSALIDPWAAFLIGALAGGIVQGTLRALERRQIDDPTGAAAVHGAAGAWGLVAAGLFANGSGGLGLNGVDGGVRGLFFGGAWHQLAAQVIGCVSGFVVVYLLGYALFSLIQKILGNRVDIEDEVNGLDWTQTGAIGYQGDGDPGEAAEK